MAIIQKKDTSQMEISSPAQICADDCALAFSIFGSYSLLRDWVNDFEVINDSAVPIEVSGFNSCAAATNFEVARSLARTHAHKP